MRAVVALPGGAFGVRDDVPSPAIGPGELLLDVRACGLCGTDLAKLAHRDTAGVRLGHEIAGIVREIGPGIQRFARGDRVVAAHHVPCGTCWACRHGSDSMCAEFKATNLDPGGFAEQVRLSAVHVAHVVHRIPDGMPFEVAAFAEPLACAVRAVERAQVQPGDRIGVYGGGGMGLLIAQALAARGAEPIVLETQEPRAALARQFGAAVLRPGSDDVEAGVRRLTDGAGLAGLILTVVTGATVTQAQRLVRAGGRLGIFAGPGESPMLPLDFADLYHRELSLLATYSATPSSLAAALDLLAKGRVHVEPLISHRLPLDAFDEGVQLQRSGRAIKVIFEP
jgi:L-iditol 2-dehydrogenase